MEIYYQYLKLKRNFGKWPNVVDEGAEMVADVRPNEEHAAMYIERSPVITCAQVIPEYSEHECNTTQVNYTRTNINHEEGGWPKDVDYTEAEHTIRFRKKVEKDEDYVKSIVKLGHTAEDRVKQNNAVDIYQRYYVGDSVQDVVAETPHAKTVTVLKDPTPVTRSVTFVDWNVEASKLVTCFSILDFQQQPEGMSLDSYVWDLANPTRPEFTMSPLSQLTSARFNLKDPNIIGGGQYNGQFAVFDIRKPGGRPEKVTPMELSHTEPVYDFAWLQSKTGTEAMTMSSDGSVLYWDTRMFDEYVERVAKGEQNIIETIELVEKGSSMRQGGVSLGYNPQAGATKFMAGCESGSILNCNRKGKDRITGTWAGHHSPVYCVQRHPIFPKCFLSIGDWRARIWAEDGKQPLISTMYHTTYLTSGSWSNSRAGVFFTTRQDGALDIWDLYFRQQTPTLHLQISTKPLTCVQNSASGQLLAVGAHDGNCTVLSLSKSMWESSKEERSEIIAMLDHEGLREKNLEKTLKEARLKAKKQAMGNGEVTDPAADQAVEEEVEKRFYEVTGAKENNVDGALPEAAVLAGLH